MEKLVHVKIAHSVPGVLSFWRLLFLLNQNVPSTTLPHHPDFCPRTATEKKTKKKKKKKSKSNTGRQLPWVPLVFSLPAHHPKFLLSTLKVGLHALFFSWDLSTYFSSFIKVADTPKEMFKEEEGPVACLYKASLQIRIYSGSGRKLMWSFDLNPH